MKAAKLTLEQHVDAFFVEWEKTTLRVAAAIEAKEFSSLVDTDILHNRGPANSINREGNRHLNEAADLLLWREKLGAKLSRNTARKALIEGFVDHLPKAKRTGILSEHAVIARAAATLRSHPRDSGTYIFPVVFAPGCKATDFRIGAARIMSKSVFEQSVAEASDAHDRRQDELGDLLMNDWRCHAENFDHFISVEITDFEDGMAWPAARDAAETLLNLIRMFVGYAAMDDVRIGNGFIWQDRQSKLRLDVNGQIFLSSSRGGRGSHLEDGWQVPFDCQLSGFAELLASAVTWHTVNDGRRHPILERLTYFNRLISEAYCEPYDPIRLVRLISALEALSVIDRHDKAHNLAHRCAAAGGWSDTGKYCEIYDAVREAYHWRNAVVHGDAPSDQAVMGAFYRLEKHLLEIYLGMLALHAGIARAVNPGSIARLRREFTQRIDLFFWAPTLAV